MRQHNMRALALLAIACGLATAAARMAPVDEASGFARALQQQQPTCSRISNCQQCYNAKNDDAVTVLVCRVCATGYRPTADGSACECAPGYYRLTDTAACGMCESGFYCLGGAAPAQSCGSGLTTLTSAARGVEQCVTLPGFGYSRVRNADNSVTVTATKCPDNFYNPGSNALPCRRCPGGLVTLPSTGPAGATNIRQCLAGPGYLFDKLVAKPCPRGTWKNTTSTATACSRCPACLTTAKVSSISIDQCFQALPGCKVVTPAVSGAPCDKNYYNIGYNNDTTCTLCSDYLVTQRTGSKSEASCVAPPGYGYYPTNADGNKTQACAIGMYKPGFNRRACSNCGAGFLTLATASDSKQRCYVPTAHGTVKISATETQVVKCMSGLFGFPVNTFGVSTLPCRACQMGMSTWDVNSGTDVNNTSPDDCWTLPGYGYDRKAQAAKICDAGTYNAGWNKEPCKPCEDGYTTAQAGATSAAQCVIAPGWYWDTRVSKPVPCDEGYYCPGLTANAASVVCPSGTTTSEQWASNITDCDVCLGGYGSYATSAGSPSCTLCSANTWAPKGGLDACKGCQTDYVSAAGSDSESDCYDEWQVLKKDFDFLPVSDVSVLSPATGASANNSEAECKRACGLPGSQCMFYQYDAYSRSCMVYNQPAAGLDTVKLGMKIDEAVYSVFNGDDSSSAIGLEVEPISATTTVEQCLRKCDEVERCVALVITQTDTGFNCSLRQGDLSADFSTKYRVFGTTINSWF